MARLRTRSAVISGVLIVAMAKQIDSCSFSDPPVLELERRPDAPIEKYLAGDLGLIRPSFARSYLVVAYRYVSGKGLSSAEQNGVAGPMEQPGPIDGWISARKVAAPDSAPPPNIARERYRERFHSYYVNCNDDAFTTAAATLAKRVATFGAGSKPVRTWVSGQDAVFANCGEDAASPPPADAALPLIIRKDRDYQIASAHFYRGEFNKAHAAFLRIAADTESHWAPLGRYLAARALVRYAALGVTDEDLGYQRPGYFAQPMSQAAEEVRSILADPKLESIHPAALRLLNYIEFRLSPSDYLKRVSRALSRGGSPTTIRNDLTDYTLLLDRGIQGDDEMTDWIRTFQGQCTKCTTPPSTRATFHHAVAQWKKRKSTLWLVAAISDARSDDAATPALLDAALTIGPSSPAYVTVRYHRIRLLRGLDRVGELDELLVHREKMGPSTRNALLSMRLPRSASLDEFIRDAPREAAGLWSQMTLESEQHYLGDDGVIAINLALPLDDLATISTHPLPEGISRTVLVAAWTRALILGRFDVVSKLAPRLSSEYPEIIRDLDAYLSSPAELRQFEAINLLIRFPGLTPYVGGPDTRSSSDYGNLSDVAHDQHTHENWWCNEGLSYSWTTHSTDSKASPEMTPDFAQKADVRARAAEERETLLAHGSGATFVLRGVVEWAKQRPTDPRVPEALSNAIKTTQWACPDQKTRAAARAAFTLLHSKYGSTPWAKKTPHWYDGSD